MQQPFRRRPPRGGAVAALIAVLCVAALLPLRPASAGEERRTLDGSAAPAMSATDRLGDEDPGEQLDVQVSLALRNRGELERLAADVSDPSSPRHGRWLTPGAFADRYAPLQGDVDAVAAYLRGAGLTVFPASANRTLVDARGSVAQVEAAFGTRIGRYRDRATGRAFRADDTPPSLPASLAATVVGVEGLQTRDVLRHHGVLAPRAARAVGTGPNGGLSPADIVRAYGFGRLGGAVGTGQTLGLLELAPFDQNDVTSYDTTFGLTTTPPVVHVVDQTPTDVADQAEVELDIELMHALAPAAHIVVWETNQQTGSDATVIDAYNHMVTDPDRAAVNSTSWGGCEPEINPATMQALDNVFLQAASQGQSFFAASGDAGAFDCAPDLPGLAVDNPADDPWVTGAGGTTLSLDANHDYAGESAWLLSGGGRSLVFPLPSYQRQSDVARGPSRQVPDVAIDADVATGYAVFVTDAGCPTGCFRVAGGTSAGAPLWAAYTAVLDQLQAAAGRPAVGFANPTLYAMRGCTTAGSWFHDVTAGDNEAFPAAPGYDLATGLGTPTGGPLVAPGPGGYRLVAADGGIFAYGQAVFAGSTGGLALNRPVVGMARTPGGCGYWLVASDGGVFNYGSARFLGSTGGQRLNAPIVGMTSTPDGLGYWLVASDGGVFSYGDARFEGSTGGMRLNKPIVGIAATPDGLGYWLVASDGGVFSFGDAAFHGGTGALRLQQPVLGMAATPDGLGYWLVAADGGVFAFGDAAYHGGTGGMRLNRPMTGMAATPDGGGYWLVASDGGIFAYGDAPFLGSTGGKALNQPVVGMASR